MDQRANTSGDMRPNLNSGNHGDTGLQAGANPGAFVFASAIGPRIMLSPEGGAAGSGGGGDGGTPPAAGAAGDEGAEGAAGSGGDGTPAPKLERPEYIPENFWDAEKGFKADDLNALVAFKAEHDANLAQVPDAPDGYAVTLPKDFKLPEGFELPEGQEMAIDENDPRIGALREFAHSKQMSQADFEGILALGVQLDAQQQAEMNAALAKQAEALGSKGKQRVQAITQWLGAKLGGEKAQALAGVLFTKTQIEAFEDLMRLNRGVLPGNPGGGRDSGKPELSDEEYEKLSPTDKINYARQHSKR